MFDVNFVGYPEGSGLPWALLPALVYSISQPMVADGTMSVNGRTSSMKLNVVKSLQTLMILGATEDR